jgi:chromosome segregation ATPase
MILPCECPSTAHCLEATGGEQGLSADELEVARLRRELGAAVDEIGTLRLRCEDYRLDAVTAREERDELRREVVEAALRLKASTAALARERDAAHAELAKALARSARLEVALVELTSSIVSTGCRDAIVWRDIEAARLAINPKDGAA